ncbi:MAG: DUF1800 family protein, partial [Acidobacteriota bacterium]|nr:DUF1800 family protein [Acidobacteriota bacterium]
TASETDFNGALPLANVVDYPGYGNEPDLWAPHPFNLRVEHPTNLTEAQSYWAWRMQYSPNPFKEKLALYWHQHFATGAKKVDNIPLILKQIQLFRDLGRGNFGDLLRAVSQDPAMMIWLDTIQNKVEKSSDVPNENYAREILELYSLGIDNGYNQKDITELAKAMTGWDYIGRDFPMADNPYYFNDGEFIVYHGQANPYPDHPWLRGYETLPDQRVIGTFTLFGVTLDLGAASQYGTDAIQLILTQRGQQCATFLAQRLLRFFLNPDLPAAVINDFRDVILANAFHIGKSLKALFKSAYFYDSMHRFALVEGPVAWSVRMAKLLGPGLAAALQPTQQNPANLPRFAAWAGFVNWDASGFFNMGQDLLNPKGPNGWKEHAAWLNSDTYRHRTRTAFALAVKESRGEDHLHVERFLFDTDFREWFPAAPASALDVFNRLAALLQPAPIPSGLRDAWLGLLWSKPFAWDGSPDTENAVRRLAFLILCSPQAQQH